MKGERKQIAQPTVGEKVEPVAEQTMPTEAEAAADLGLDYLSAKASCSSVGCRNGDQAKNISWGILGGWVSFVYFVAIGIVYGITIIGVKKAYACFRFALFTLAPFGKNVATDIGSHKFGNAFWIVTTGWQISLYCVLAAALWYATYFGRYLGAKWLHLAQFVIAPFGAKIRKNDLLSGDDTAFVELRDRDSEFEL